jgi:DNA-binding cell septation regulator SpoVG
MKIDRMNKVSINNLLAFFDIKTSDGFILKGFTLVKSKNDGGMFVGFPSKQDKEGEWKDTIWCDKQLRQEVNKLAHDEYNSSSDVDDFIDFDVK